MDLACLGMLALSADLPTSKGASIRERISNQEYFGASSLHLRWQRPYLATSHHNHMKKLFTTPHTWLLCLAICCQGIAIAQSNPGALVQKYNPKLPDGAQKITSHNDYPGMVTRQIWTPSSSTWDNSFQITYAYLTNGEPAEAILAYYNGSTFLNSSRTLYGYDSLYNLGLILDFNWINNAWMPSERTTLTYNSLGYQTMVVAESYNGFQWDTTYGFRGFFTYVNTDLLESATYQDWDGLGLSWQNNNMYTNHYNASWQRDTTYESYWNGLLWDPYFRYAYAWQNNEWDTVTRYIWDFTDWTPQERTSGYQWHNFTKQLPTYYDEQLWSGGAWADYLRFGATYTTNDSRIEIIETMSTTWDSSSKKIISYDSRDHLTADEGFQYSGGWNPTYGYRAFHTYNGAGRRLEYYTQNYDTTGYTNFDKWIYADFFTAVTPAMSQPLAVTTYPNPVGQGKELNFNVQLERPSPVTIALYDLRGQLRMESAVPMTSGHVQFQISESLENGTYIYTVRTKAGEATGKVIVQR
jgi:hypothetical protein